MSLERHWMISEPHPQAMELAGRLKVSALVSQILLTRGYSQPEECSDFLRPNLKSLDDPGLLPNLAKAAERIARAIRDKEKIVIYGDYDVDGITATSILWHAIRVLGGDSHYYIPHRLEEGYGLNSDAITEICNDGAGLIISVDCGVSAFEPAKVARDRGIDLIITDHHEIHEDHTTHQQVIPDCYTVVHPRLNVQDKPAYPNPHLCGAGVAFKLAWGIGTAISGAVRVSDTFRAFLLEATAFAGLGTIADVVPLVGENRILAAFGLGGLKNSQLVGIKALIESAALTGQKLDSYDVGFKLAPRINASGRMGHAKLAVEMLTDASAERAHEIAEFLEQQNRQRQTIERSILDSAVNQAKELGYDRDDCRGIVLGAEGWHAGVIGIVASRIVERFHRPTVMVALNNGHGQGSGRSITGFHLAKALDACTEFLEGHGGHEMAAGLKMKSENLAAFREAFAKHAASVLCEEHLTPTLKLEATAKLADLKPAVVRDLQRLGPFGQANRRPILFINDLVVAGNPKRVGKTGDHLQLFVRQGTDSMKCIAFKFGDRIDQLQPGKRINLAVEPTINEFNGISSVELEVKDLRFV